MKVYELRFVDTQKTEEIEAHIKNYLMQAIGLNDDEFSLTEIEVD